MRRSPTWPVLAIFLLSGAAGLIYEVVWSRQLVLVFGNTTEATSAILTGFFGGMAIGALAGGRLADRVHSPLRLYGALELATVAVVVVTPGLFHLIGATYRTAFGSLETTTGALALVRFALAMAALGPATVLMGATLPALTRHLRRDGSLSEAFGRLYAVNVTGAIAGTAAAGFVLIEALGLSGALLAGCACSAIAGLLALALSAREASLSARNIARAEPRPAREDAGQTRQGRANERASRAPRLALAIAFSSGLTSLGYQVLWNRMLGEGTGASTYVFTVILATFLVGLALGAVAFAFVGRRIRDVTGLIALTQGGVAILAVAGLALVLGHPPQLPLYTDKIDTLLSILARRALLIVLPTTVLLGFCFPAASALLADRTGETARETGLLLALNTTGSIAGTFLVPFVLVPLAGSAGSLVMLATLNVAIAVGLGAWRARALVTARMGALSGAAGAVAIVVALGSGAVVSPSLALARERGAQIFATREDEIASVVAGRLGDRAQLWVGGTSMTALTVDTKLMPVLAVALRPHATRALVVAFGMGSAYRNALLEGLRTDTVELVPSVPPMLRYFYPDAARILADPNGRVIIADGRNHLELTRDTYDIILVDPPPPIQTAGVSVIASLEFYRAGAAHLRPGGVMMEWVPFGETVPEFRAIVRTFASAFVHVLIARGPGGNGFFLFGSSDPLQFDQAGLRAALDRPGIVADLSGAYDAPVKGLDAWAAYLPSRLWLRDAQLMRYAGAGPLVTDDHPLPEYFLLRHTLSPAPYLGYSLPAAIGPP